MAGSTSLTTRSSGSPFGQGVTEKLAKGNHVLWRAQVLSVIRGAELDAHLDADHTVPNKEISITKEDGTVKEPNPDYTSWVAQDQQVLTFLLTTLSREVQLQVVNNTTAATMWTAIQKMYSSQSHARTVNLRISLANMQKGNSTIAEYFSKIRSLSDEMEAAGKKLEEEDIVSYILAGLDAEYNSIVSAMCSRVEPVTVAELFAQLR